MVMKKTFVIILDMSFTNYEVALVNLNKERLITGDSTYPIKFAQKWKL